MWRQQKYNSDITEQLDSKYRKKKHKFKLTRHGVKYLPQSTKPKVMQNKYLYTATTSRVYSQQPKNMFLVSK